MKLLEQLARARTILALEGVVLVAIVILIALEPVRPDGSVENSVGELIGGVVFPSAILAWYAASVTYRVGVYRRIGSYESRTDSQVPVQPSQRVQAQGILLQSLGFPPLGQYEYRFPWQRWKQAWVFSQHEQRVEARVGEGLTPCFASRWRDGSQLLTVKGWPGRVMELPSAKVIVASGSLASLYGLHVRQAADITQTRGAPLPTPSLGEAVARDASDLPLTRAIMRSAMVSPVSLAALVVPIIVMLAILASGLHLL